MVFQALLFLGYLYAHLLAPRLGVWHLLVLLLPLLQFTSEVSPNAPTITLIFALIGQISIPFVVLSTTAVVAQSWWYSAKKGSNNTPPFFLYGVSNFGAMIALLAYPFLIEPIFGITIQRWIWSIGYLFYVGLTISIWYLLVPQKLILKRELVATRPYFLPTIFRWLLLAAIPSGFLLATTNFLTMEVGSFPLVWIFPLGLYLSSFTLAFRENELSIFRLGQF